MNKKIIKVPKGIKMLSEWTDFLNNIPDGKVILNKKLTGCGATTLFLKVDKPLILCAHRTELLSCKANADLHKSEVYLFNNMSEGLSSNISNLNKYLDSCQTSPKILVTIDSLHYVIDVLEKRGELKNYCVVSDEMQCIFTDSVFKGDIVFKYLNDLGKIDNIIYLSATPYMETYLDQLDEFKNLPYIELDWESEEPGRVIKPNIKTFNVSSLVKELNKIIERYKTDGYFESKVINGVPYKAEQGIFYLNSVEDIIKAIKSNKLSPEECNIICSRTNKKNLDKLKKLGFSVGSVQKKGELHKTFTFVTKCAFEGVDMYHPSGITYIFADPNLHNLSLDISIDIEQIMGRQRLESNVFRYDAIMFFKTTKETNIISQKDFEKDIKKKINYTKEKINYYNSLDDELKEEEFKSIDIIHNSVGFKVDYISFYPNPITNELEARENILVKISEYRAWDIKCNNYFNQLRVISGINKICGDYQYPIDKLFGTFYITNDFPTRMKAYCDFLNSYPEAQDEVEQKSVGIINSEYHTYYRKLGPDKIRANSYRRSMLESLINASKVINIKDKILEVFRPGTTLPKKEIKKSLQDIYNNLGIKKTAKATDLEEYFDISPTLLKDKGHCFKILKEK